MKNLVAYIEAEDLSVADAMGLAESGFAVIHKNGYALILQEQEA